MKSAFFQGFSAGSAIQKAVYWSSRWICFGLSKILFALRVEGGEHIPASGAAIIAANHVSYFDPVIVALAVRRPVHFMAKGELFRFRPFGWLLRQYFVFPVDRKGSDVQAMKRALRLLAEGEILAMFPEGTRGDGSRLGPAKPGIGLIAARSGAPVIPAFHRGTEKALPRGTWIPRPYPISVRFGPPLRFAEVQVGEGHGRVFGFSQTIMGRIAALHTRLEGGAGTSDCRNEIAGGVVSTDPPGIREQRG